METVNIHEAKTHLSRLIEKAVAGEPFIIAKAGKPMVKVTAVEGDRPGPGRQMGFLRGRYKVPSDIKAFGRSEIDEMFFGNPDKLKRGRSKR